MSKVIIFPNEYKWETYMYKMWANKRASKRTSQQYSASRFSYVYVCDVSAHRIKWHFSISRSLSDVNRFDTYTRRINEKKHILHIVYYNDWSSDCRIDGGDGGGNISDGDIQPRILNFSICSERIRWQSIEKYYVDHLWEHVYNFSQGNANRFEE